jgi:hypothetical protein
MKFRIRVVNPVVRLLLGLPLHRLFSSSLVILAYQGRRTGGWHRLPCMYASDGQDLYIVAAQPDRKLWWRNLLQPARVRLHLQGRDVEGTATATSDPEAVAAGLVATWRAIRRRPSRSGSAWTPAARPTPPTQPPTRWSWVVVHLDHP